VAWDGRGPVSDNTILYREINANGTFANSETTINVTTAGVRGMPAVALRADSGSAVVSWTDHSAIKSQVVARRIDGSGNPSGGEITVGTVASVDQANASVGLADGGNFVIAYAQNDGGTKWNIYARRFNSSGSALDATPVQVNTLTSGNQATPDIAVRGPDGAYAVVWTDDTQDGDKYGIFAHLFNPDSTRDGSEFGVNNYTHSDQQRPAIAWSGGRMAAVWDGEGSSDSDGVYARRYSTPLPANRAPVNSVPAGQTT